MATTTSTLIAPADYSSIALQYGYVRNNMTIASGYLYNTVYTVVQFYSNAVFPTLDLLQPFYTTYQVGQTSLLDNSLFVNAVKALQQHVINRGGYSTVGQYLNANSVQVSDEFAAISAAAGYTIENTYINMAY